MHRVSVHKHNGDVLIDEIIARKIAIHKPYERQCHLTVTPIGGATPLGRSIQPSLPGITSDAYIVERYAMYLC
jgi:hypothetical protein